MNDRKPCILNRCEVRRIFEDAGMLPPNEAALLKLGEILADAFRCFAMELPRVSYRKDVVTGSPKRTTIITPSDIDLPAARPIVAEPVIVPALPDLPQSAVKETVRIVKREMKAAAALAESHPGTEPPKAPQESLVSPPAPPPPQVIMVAHTTNTVACTQCMYVARGADKSMYCRNELSEHYRKRTGESTFPLTCPQGEYVPDENLEDLENDQFDQIPVI